MPKIDSFLAKIVKVDKPRKVTLQIKKCDERLMKSFIAKYLSESDSPVITLSARYNEKKRTLGQNKLYWALVNVLAFETYQQNGWAEYVHEELLSLYAPQITSKFTGKEVSKRSRHMTTVEFSLLIEGVFCELTSMGLEINTGEKIRQYWIEWRNWRGKQGVDPLSTTYRDRDEYIHRIPFCEATLRYLWGTDEKGGEAHLGSIMHIVSKGSGGADEPWNWLHIGGEPLELMHETADPHIGEQHKHGWGSFIERYPHLLPKVQAAHDRAGSILVLSGDRDVEPDLTEDLGDPGECRACGAKIFWQKTEAGKNTPVNPDGTTHWATCPKAELFKTDEKEAKQDISGAKEVPVDDDADTDKELDIF